MSQITPENSYNNGKLAAASSVVCTAFANIQEQVPLFQTPDFKGLAVATAIVAGEQLFHSNRSQPPESEDVNRVPYIGNASLITEPGSTQEMTNGRRILHALGGSLVRVCALGAAYRIGNDASFTETIVVSAGVMGTGLAAGKASTVFRRIH